MPNQKIPLSTPYKNIDDTSLTSQLNIIQDGYLDESDAIHQRPGLELLVDLGTNKKVDGLFWSDTKEVVMAVSNGKTFKITDKFGANTDLTGNSLIPERPVSFAEAYSGADLYLFMANGGGLTFTNYTANTQLLSGSSTPALTGTGSPPTNITSLVNFNTYMITNSEDSNSWYFSNPNSPFAWDLSDSYDAEKSPDSVDAIKVVNNRLLICGKSSIEPWYNAGTPGDPLLRSLKANFVNAGVLSPFSIDVVDENRMFFINKDRRIASIQGNSYQVLSKAYDKEIQGFSSARDAVAFTLNEGGKSFYVISFPQDKKTLVYDIELKHWYEWGYWNETKSQYEIFKGNCYTYARKWNQHLIGSSDGKIYKVSSSYYNDAGDTIRGKVVTGHANYGSDAVLKNSKRLTGRFKRGVGKSSDSYTEPYFLIRKRDNGKSKWSDYKKVDLGKLGETELSRTISTRNGRYYTRQMEIVFPDDAPFVMSGLWEDLEAESR